MPHQKLRELAVGPDSDDSEIEEDMTPVRHPVRTQSTLSMTHKGLSGMERRRDSYAVASTRIEAHKNSRANTQFVKEIEERDRKVMERVAAATQILSGKSPNRRRPKPMEQPHTIQDTVAALSSDDHVENAGIEGLKPGKQVRDWIANKREATRRAVIQRSAVEAAELRAHNQAKHHEDEMRRLEMRVAAAAEDAQAARNAEHETRAKASRERDKRIAAERVASLLRSRLRQLSARRMESERKLIVFERFMPLFEVLSDRYDYSITPEGLISRLEVLERAQVELLSDLGHAQERLVEVERDFATQGRTWEDDRQKLATEYTLSQERNEAKGAVLEATVRGTEEEMNVMSEKVERLARLESALLDLWTAVVPVEWHEWQEDEQNEDGLASARETLLPNVKSNDDIQTPEQVVSALTLILTMRHPDRRETSLRKLSGLAHRVWLKYYTESNPELKSRPFATFEKIFLDSVEMNADNVKLRARISEMEKEKKKLIGSLPVTDPRRSGRIPRRTPDSRPVTHLGFV